MGTAHTELQNMQAAKLPQALHERLLAAMAAATGEAADIRGTEKTLRRPPGGTWYTLPTAAPI